MNNTNQVPMIVRNELGFLEVEAKPSQGDLKEYYAKKYFQSEQGNYRNRYSIKEKEYFSNKIAQSLAFIASIRGKRPGDFLDIGCGEGFAMASFWKEGWQVTGLDYSDFGCSQMNRDCLPFLIAGDIYESLARLIEKGATYDVIWLTNVLEHVPDPIALLRDCKLLAHENTVMVVRVPNDFSLYQQHLLENGYVSKPFWIAYPDHLSYFDKNSLEKAAKSVGWTSRGVHSDFPIDLFLLNKHSNYVEDKERGAAAHQARIEFENLIHRQGIEKVNEWYRAAAELGIGRDLTGYFTLKD